jgi:hypothetical protein
MLYSVLSIEQHCIHLTCNYDTFCIIKMQHNVNRNYTLQRMKQRNVEDANIYLYFASLESRYCVKRKRGFINSHCHC